METVRAFCVMCGLQRVCDDVQLEGKVESTVGCLLPDSHNYRFIFLGRQADSLFVCIAYLVGIHSL